MFAWQTLDKRLHPLSRSIAARPQPSWLPLKEELPMRKSTFAGAALIGVATLAASNSANAQYRMPLPGYWQMAPRLALPAMRGASQFGWNIGRNLSIRQYGRAGDPGRW